MRRVLYIALPIVLIAVVVIGLTQAGGGGNLGDGTDFDLPGAKKTLATAPAPLGGLYAQANTLIGGGETAFDQRIAELKGTPVIVNKWASWCGPCQAEFPVFQEAAVTHGKEIAFVGLNAHDKDPAAKKFLSTRPLPFPSYTDPNDEIARKQEIAVGFPMTQFIDRDGKTAYIHTGPYTDERAAHRGHRALLPLMPEVRVDPLTGLKVIVADGRAAPAGRGVRHPARHADRPGDRPVRAGQRGADAAGDPPRRRPVAGSRGAEQVPRARPGRAASPSATRTPTSSPPSPPPARTR